MDTPDPDIIEMTEWYSSLFQFSPVARRLKCNGEPESLNWQKRKLRKSTD
jgi:hypothetical protein